MLGVALAVCVARFNDQITWRHKVFWTISVYANFPASNHSIFLTATIACVMQLLLVLAVHVLLLLCLARQLRRKLLGSCLQHVHAGFASVGSLLFVAAIAVRLRDNSDLHDSLALAGFVLVPSGQVADIVVRCMLGRDAGYAATAWSALCLMAGGTCLLLYGNAQRTGQRAGYVFETPGVFLVLAFYLPFSWQLHAWGRTIDLRSSTTSEAPSTTTEIP